MDNRRLHCRRLMAAPWLFGRRAGRRHADTPVPCTPWRRPEFAQGPLESAFLDIVLFSFESATEQGAGLCHIIGSAVHRDLEALPDFRMYFLERLEHGGPVLRVQGRVILQGLDTAVNLDEGIFPSLHLCGVVGHLNQVVERRLKRLRVSAVYGLAHRIGVGDERYRNLQRVVSE